MSISMTSHILERVSNTDKKLSKSSSQPLENVCFQLYALIRPGIPSPRPSSTSAWSCFSVLVDTSCLLGFSSNGYFHSDDMSSLQSSPPVKSELSDELSSGVLYPLFVAGTDQ